jgi:hypothetical protein
MLTGNLLYNKKCGLIHLRVPFLSIKSMYDTLIIQLCFLHLNSLSFLVVMDEFKPSRFSCVLRVRFFDIYNITYKKKKESY